MSVWSWTRCVLGMDVGDKLREFEERDKARREREFKAGPRLLTSFLWARIDELEAVDPDGAARCRQVIDDCCVHINAGTAANIDHYVLGEVHDILPLKRLARNWAGHPDYHPRWSVE